MQEINGNLDETEYNSWTVTDKGNEQICKRIMIIEEQLSLIKEELGYDEGAARYSEWVDRLIGEE